MQEAGTLTKLSLAWSRDGGKKVYVQDRMREEGAELFAWLEKGAHFYICGDAKRMAKDVESALVDAVAEHGKSLGGRRQGLRRCLEEGRPLSGRTSIEGAAMNAPAAAPAVRTTCPYCGVGCGVIARPTASAARRSQGDPDHPANFGRLCSKGSALGETLSLDGRLLHPMVRGADGVMARASWDDGARSRGARLRAKPSTSTGRTPSRSTCPGSF